MEISSSHKSHRGSCDREPPRVKQLLDLYAMLNDFADINYEIYDSTHTARTSNIEGAPNDSTKKFYEVILEMNAPIYPCNTKYTRLNFTIKLLQFKNNLHCTNKTFNNLFKLLTDVLPKKHTHVAWNLL